MTTLASISPIPGSVRKARRRCRGNGSGLGTTGGRGYNGDKSRSGSRQKTGFEGGQMPLYRRLPKRGFKNRFHQMFQVVNLSLLQKNVTGDNLVDPDRLKTLGLIKNEKEPVKILGDGEITFALTVRAHAFSKVAEDKIRRAGGVAERL